MTVMIVGAGPYQVSAVGAAQRLGHRVLVVDRNPTAPAMALADEAAVVDIIDEVAVVALAQRARVSAALTVASDAALPAVAAVVKALGLPGLAPETVARCRDKERLAEAMVAAGLAHPRTVAVTNVAEVLAFGLPCVLKPSGGAGGRGVRVVHTVDHVAAALAGARACLPVGGRVLAQTFVQGVPVGVEVFMVGGRPGAFYAFNDQLRPGFVSPVGHSLPSRLTSAQRAELEAAVCAFALAVGLGDGPANLDLRWTAEGPVLIELNPRAGGSSIAALVAKAHGVDLAEAAVRAALGEDPTPALRSQRAVAVAARLVLAEGRGPVYLHGARPSTALRLDVRDGEPAPLAVEGWSLLGRVLVTGADAYEAERRAEALATTFEAQIEVMSR